MLRTLFSRRLIVTAVVCALGAALGTSCGSGGGAAKEMVLVELQFLDRALQPAAPTGTQSLPRNAIIGMVFSERVNPHSVSNQTMQLRFGGSFQSVPAGAFSVDGTRVLFDPTITAQGQPNPLGFEPLTQYVISIPGAGDQAQVVENLDSDPNLVSFFTQFTTAEGWLRELDPPSVVSLDWVPGTDPLTKQIPGNGLMAINFSEAMDPAGVVLGLDPVGPLPSTTIDIRYTDAGVNQTNNIDGVPIAGSFTTSPDLRTLFFKPLFSFGDEKLVFTVQVLQGLRDLAGNSLVNPGAFGPYTCDGQGIATGKVIAEDFTTTAKRDGGATTADWGSTTDGVVQGVAVTSRKAYVYSYVETDTGTDSGRGQYAPLAAPMVGPDLKTIVPNPVPPTAEGRRVMWTFSDTKIGAGGAVTAVAWGPDSNQTYAAFYPNIRLRIGYQQSSSLTLAPSFSGNYEGNPTLIYSGDYAVQSNSDVGNTPGHPTKAHVGGYAVGGPPVGICTPNWNQPLFTWTGWYDWPAPSTYFEWTPGDLGKENDRVLVFDASVPEGDTFQLVRGWFGSTYPCSGFLINGLPLTRMYSTYEGETPNPATNLALGIQNPEQSTSDTCFTLTQRTSFAQSVFYGAAGETFGSTTDYLPAVLTPAVQAGGAQVIVEYQGATDVAPDNVTINTALPFTDWVQDVNLCDGMGFIRYRLRLVSNLVSLQVAKVEQVILPMVDSSSP